MTKMQRAILEVAACGTGAVTLNDVAREEQCAPSKVAGPMLSLIERKMLHGTIYFATITDLGRAALEEDNDLDWLRSGSNRPVARSGGLS